MSDSSIPSAASGSVSLAVSDGSAGVLPDSPPEVKSDQPLNTEPDAAVPDQQHVSIPVESAPASSDGESAPLDSASSPAAAVETQSIPTAALDEKEPGGLAVESNTDEKAEPEELPPSDPILCSVCYDEIPFPAPVPSEPGAPPPAPTFFCCPSRDLTHSICLSCFSNFISHCCTDYANDTFPIRCPYNLCNLRVPDGQLRALITACDDPNLASMYERFSVLAGILDGSKENIPLTCQRCNQFTVYLPMNYRRRAEKLRQIIERDRKEVAAAIEAVEREEKKAAAGHYDIPDAPPLLSLALRPAFARQQTPFNRNEQQELDRLASEFGTDIIEQMRIMAQFQGREAEPVPAPPSPPVIQVPDFPPPPPSIPEPPAPPANIPDAPPMGPVSPNIPDAPPLGPNISVGSLIYNPAAVSSRAPRVAFHNIPRRQNQTPPGRGDIPGLPPPNRGNGPVGQSIERRQYRRSAEEEARERARREQADAELQRVLSGWMMNARANIRDHSRSSRSFSSSHSHNEVAADSVRPLIDSESDSKEARLPNFRPPLQRQPTEGPLTSLFVLCETPNCGAATCLHCDALIDASETDSHECKISPIEEMYNRVSEVLSDGAIQKCPGRGCTARGEKDTACCHITCPSCHIRWCYVCGRSFTDFSTHNGGWDIRNGEGRNCPMYLHYRYGRGDINGTGYSTGDAEEALQLFHCDKQRRLIQDFESNLLDTERSIYEDMKALKFPNGMFPLNLIRRLEEIERQIDRASGSNPNPQRNRHANFIGIGHEADWAHDIDPNRAANLRLIELEPAGPAHFRPNGPPRYNGGNWRAGAEPTCCQKFGDCLSECGEGAINCICCNCDDEEGEMTALGTVCYVSCMCLIALTMPCQWAYRKIRHNCCD